MRSLLVKKSLSCTGLKPSCNALGCRYTISLQKYRYLTDGNSVFLTALEALHRRLSIPSPIEPGIVGVVVSVGYLLSPDSSSVFDPRRRCDLTPPAPGRDPAEGGADEFIDFISDEVRGLVQRRLQETRGVNPGKDALYGHSFGGLFCLHTLFTRPNLFDCFIASSPSIWWNNKCLLREEASFCEMNMDDSREAHKPSLMMFVGGQEQNPPRYRKEKDKEYEERLRLHQEWRMIDNVRESYARLENSGKFSHTSCMVYEGEDHGTIMSCSLNRGLVTFLEDWPYRT